jgi:hypothetical protein
MRIVLEILIFLLQNYHDHEEKDIDKALTIASYIVTLKRNLKELL